MTALSDQDDAGAQILSALTPEDGLLPYLPDVRKGTSKASRTRPPNPKRFPVMSGCGCGVIGD